MSFFSWLGTARSGSRSNNSKRIPRNSRRLCMEPLEQRSMLASYDVTTVPELISAMDAANLTAEADTISLATGLSFTLASVNNFGNGATGLPAIAAGQHVTVVGNGSVIERSNVSGTPAFRLFTVPLGASLELENVKLQGGWASGFDGRGGAIYSQGTLKLAGVTIQNNLASQSGGGIYSSGDLTLENSLILGNKALGYRGVDASNSRGGPIDASNGTSAFGGGLFIGGGTALLSGVTLSGNTAQGGDGGNGVRGAHGGSGGDGFGGGLCAMAGEVTVRNSTVTENSAIGGARGKLGDSAGLGIGGGLYLDSDVVAALDAFTVNKVKRNNASTSDANIRGSYVIN